jgi:hypothetical protein
MKIIGTVFEKIAVMSRGDHLEGPYFGDRMFIFIRHRPVMDEVLNTEYEVKAPSRRAFLHAERRHSKITFACSERRVVSKYVIGQILEMGSFSRRHNSISCVLRIRDSKNTERSTELRMVTI